MAKSALGVKSRKQGDVWMWILAHQGPEGGHTPTTGTLGPICKDANPEHDNSAYLSEESQGDHAPWCIHGLVGGKGCYLCDPTHPYRLKQVGAT
jgi:hypothetical protein